MKICMHGGTRFLETISYSTPLATESEVYSSFPNSLLTVEWTPSAAITILGLTSSFSPCTIRRHEAMSSPSFSMDSRRASDWTAAPAMAAFSVKYLSNSFRSTVTLLQ